jgi:hypothetical protein
MLNLGTVIPNSVLYIPFDTFSVEGPSANPDTFVASHVRVYRNGNPEEAGAVDAGVTVIARAFDGLTGIHGISINLAADTAGFYRSGDTYWVVINGLEIEDQIVNFVAAIFKPGYTDAIVNTYVSAFTGETHLVLAAAPNLQTNLDGITGCAAVVTRTGSTGQECFRSTVATYTPDTRQVILSSAVPWYSTAPTAAADISLFLPVNVGFMGGVAQAGQIVAANVVQLDNSSTPIDGKSVSAALSYIAAAVAGKCTGAGTGTERFYGLDGTTERVRVAAAANGNRTTVTYDPA